MSSSSTNASSGQMPRLGPAWLRGGNQGGRGFQPPPAVPSERRGRSGSASSAGSAGGNEVGGPAVRPTNKFSVLEEDDDNNIHNIHNNNSSRSDALKGAGAGAPRPKSCGRSLADLAARAPPPPTSNKTTATPGAPPPAAGAGGAAAAPESGGGGRFAHLKDAVDSDKKSIRFTRERLLSMRPAQPNQNVPELLHHLEGSSIVTKEPQDPVCWDTFDADEIWAAAARERRAVPAKAPPMVGERERERGGVATVERSGGSNNSSSSSGNVPTVPPPEVIPKRTSGTTTATTTSSNNNNNNNPNGGGGGRWQRGVALPPADERRAAEQKAQDANNPDQLWDDPMTSPATDFSGFGAIPDDPKLDDSAAMIGGGGGGPSAAVGAFDFGAMAEATAQFDDERNHRTATTSGGGSGGSEDDTNAQILRVDPKRPLAAAGTTIRSGSGDGANVFEDFDEDVAQVKHGEEAVAGSADGPTASSRLMKMIGVDNEASLGEAAAAASSSAWGGNMDGDPPGGGGGGGPTLNIGSSAIPSNPWGASIGGAPPATAAPSANQNVSGMDLSARLEAARNEQVSRDAHVAEEQRRQMEQAEMQRRSNVQAQQEAHARQQQQQHQQQQQPGMPQQQQPGMPQHQQQQQQQQPENSGGVAHTQVELILMERISTILESSWGRSDLLSILTTLHSEDSRVVPLLSNIDAMRALLVRHPRRVVLKMDPNSFGDQLGAVLVINNAQFQQQQQQQQAQAQQEEIQRQQQQRLQVLQQQEQAAAAARAEAEARERAAASSIVPGAPWFYADPQNNIQGPFKGEEMRQWLEAGYFKGDLPISQQPTGPFRPLSQIFQDLSLAFDAQGSSSVDDEAKAIAEAEEVAARAAAEQVRAEAAEGERRRMKIEAANAAAQQEKNQQSAQLKNLLGLGATDSLNSAEVADKEKDTIPSKKQQEAKRPQSERLKKQAAKQQQRSSPPRAAPSSSSTAAAPAAWGGGAAAKTAPKKSMSEIQHEESRAAAINAMKKGSVPRSSSSGWANVAAKGGGSSGWQGGAVKPTPTAIVTNPGAITAGAASNTRMAPPAKQQVQPVPVVTTRPAAANRQPHGGTVTQQKTEQQKAADEFGAGGRMAPALETWCKDQMRKLNGTDDLTLVTFCMTLNDGEEIRQYLTAYLGTDTSVNNFATEFINRKSGKSQQDEWESATTKKNKKKKGVTK